MQNYKQLQIAKAVVDPCATRLNCANKSGAQLAPQGRIWED